jgi:hypothetical protein
VAWINASGYKGAAKGRLTSQTQGTLHNCTIAMRVIADDSRALNDRSLFEQRWREHPDYVADVRPNWEALEQRMGYEPEAFNCPTWQGNAEPFTPEPASYSCCFAQDEATCEAQATRLHVTAVTVRRAGGF